MKMQNMPNFYLMELLSMYVPTIYALDFSYSYTFFQIPIKMMNNIKNKFGNYFRHCGLLAKPLPFQCPYEF